MLFWKKSSAGSLQRASAWRRLVRSLKQNASDVDVFNKVSLRAAGREEARLTNSDMENNEAGLIIVITIIMFSVWVRAEEWRAAWQRDSDTDAVVASHKSVVKISQRMKRLELKHTDISVWTKPGRQERIQEFYNNMWSINNRLQRPNQQWRWPVCHLRLFRFDFRFYSAATLRKNHLVTIRKTSYFVLKYPQTTQTVLMTCCWSCAMLTCFYFHVFVSPAL